MFRVYKENRLFFNLSFLFALLGALVLLLTEKGEVELFVNKHSNVYLDFFFFYITYLGDGIMMVLIILMLLTVKIYYGFLGAVIFIISSIITQSMKRLVFFDSPRPSKFFDAELGLKYIEGLNLHSWYSFPSGHSSGAFTVLLLLSLLARRPWVEVLCFVLASFAAFSRVYLLQHFFMDIYAGALIGIFTTALLYFLINYKTQLPSNRIMNKSLSQLLRKQN